MKLSSKIVAAAFVVAIALTVTTAASAATFTQYLTIGSTGAEVSALQSVLISGGYLNVAAPTGFYGALTKAAVMKYQAAKGISTTGGVGPLTRAALNNGSAPVAGGNLPAGCVAGAAFSSTTGQPCTGSTSLPAGCVAGAMFSSTTGLPCASTPVVTTNGAEGYMTVTQSNAGLPSTIYEGDQKVGVLSFKVEAKNSNITVQRIKVDLGISNTVYTKKFSKIYILDGSSVIASSDLNSDTVVKESGRYTITLSGMNLVIAKDSTKVLTIAVDVNPSVDSTYRSSSSSFSLTTDAIRGVDGAGLNEYAGDTSITRTVSSISTALTDSANVKLSLNSNTPKATQVIASNGVNQNEADKVPVLVFNLKADKDDIKVTDLAASISGTAATNGNVTTAYLFDGSTELSNSSIVAGVATFSDIDLTISNGSVKPLTIKVDIRNATGTKTVAASVANTQITAENSVGDSLSAGSTITGGPATGESMTISKSGAQISVTKLAPSKTTVTDSGVSSSTLTAKFVYHVTASGQDVVLGTTGSTTGAFASSTSFVVYKNGAAIAQSAAPTISAVSYEIPDNVTVDSANNTFTIADGNSADITVTVVLTTTTIGNTFSIQTNALNVNNTLVNFMAGQSAWRSDSVVLP